MTTRSPAPSESPWFVSRGHDLAAHPRLVCFPHAGGNSRAFLDWQPALRHDAEVVAVTVPGRGHRADEPPPADVDQLADGAAAAIAAAGDRPIILFGHSLGALVAFEVARRLRGLPALRHLVASGCAAPSLIPSERVVCAARLEGREFAQAIAFFGGLPPEVVAAEELHDLLLPNLMGDFRLVARYRYRPARPLAIGVSLVIGAEDPHVDADRIAPWRRECAAPPAEHWIGGGHFYFERGLDPIFDVLRPLLRDARDIPPGDRVELI
jgi:surfactin synthase thioesterase subunit